MMSWMGPQQYHTWHGRSAPAGWPGSWPPAAPMPNPPPQPAGVDPRAWMGGQWQWNPMFQGNPAAQAALWAPHPSWGIPAAAAHPPKRKLNTGDAAYWATDLSKNPLGLENMYTAEELEKMQKEKEEREASKHRKADDGVPQTPWLWVPKELSKSDDRPTEKPLDAGNGRAVRDSQSSSEPRQHHYSSKQPHTASASMSAQQMQDQQERARRHHHHASTHRSLSQNIHSSSDAEGAKPIRHARAESLAQSSVQPSSAPAAVSSFSQYYQQQQQRQQQQKQQQQQQSRQQELHAQAVTPNPPRTPTHVSTASAPVVPPPAVSPRPPRTPTHVSTASSQNRPDDDNADSVFSSHRQLKPTFSASIIRTPQHYNTIGSSSASAAARAGTPTRASVREAFRDDAAVRPSPLASPPRHKSAPSRNRYSPADTDTETDDEPLARPHFHGPIYGPPTPSPSGRTESGGTMSSQASQSSRRDSTIPSIISTMSSMSLDTPPTSAASSVFLRSFSDEPDEMLSPLIVSSAPAPSKSSPSPRELGRNHTFPLMSTSSQSPANNIPAIPEESPAVSLSRAPSKTSRTPKRSPSVHTRTPGRSRTYPTIDPTLTGEPAVIPPMPSPTHMPPVVPSRVPSPIRGKNPLPPPPMPSSYLSTASSSASASAAAGQASQDLHRRRTQSQARSSSRPPSDSYQSYQSQAAHPVSHASSYQPPHQSSAQASPHRSSHYSHGTSSNPSPKSPPRGRRQVRYGYWNRRGDHLLVVADGASLPSPRSAQTAQQYIVYAPKHLANPEELAHYPHVLEGWMNHRGETLPYNGNVKEYPDSLPYRGEDPKMPYTSFVRYIDV